MPSFFDALPTFTEFDQVLDGTRYVAAPSDAWVAITDVKGSTKAVEAGRYKDVNALGVASILAAQNAAGVTMPYVFGGDGASLVVPAEHRERVAEALASLCGLAASQLGLTLRAAMVPVAELHRRGATVEIASYQAGGSIRFAMFRGGGLALAEALAKSADEGPTYALAPTAAGVASLEGFECRWNPIDTKHGTIACVLVKAESDAVYQQVLAFVAERCAHGGRIGSDQLSLARDAASFRVEAALRGGAEGTVGHALHRLVARATTALGRWLLESGRKLTDFDGRTYRDDVLARSDTRKFDDCLRMVLDLDMREADALEAYLAEQEAAGRLSYGVHRARSALMTCVVRDHQDNHVHFIDGAEGGYTYAARAMKAKGR